MFLDVRGETKNFNDILDGFDYGIFDVVELENVKDFKKLMKNIGVFWYNIQHTTIKSTCRFNLTSALLVAVTGVEPAIYRLWA